MKVEIINPSDRLKSIIRSYTIIETTVPMETIVLPHTGLVMAVQFKGEVSLRNSSKTERIAPLTLSGMRKDFRKFYYAANTGTLLISFTEAGASSVFGEVVFELFGHAEPLGNLMKQSVTNEIQERMAHMHSNQERIRSIEKFFISNLKYPKPDKLVLTAVNKIQSAKGLNRIADISKQLCVKQDAFEKRFRRVVGATPKQFSTIIRMKSIVKNYTHFRSLTDLAYDYEFYDQSHFIKQFKNFAGQAPKDFFKTSYNW